MHRRGLGLTAFPLSSAPATLLARLNLNSVQKLRDTWMDRVVVQADGCWLWRGSRRGGYGLIGAVALRERGLLNAHVAAYLLFRGEVSEGMHVHHLCGEKGCANPDHLELLTPSEHVREHGRGGDVCKRGHVPNWSILKSGDRACRDCERERSLRRRMAAKHQERRDLVRRQQGVRGFRDQPTTRTAHP